MSQTALIVLLKAVLLSFVRAFIGAMIPLLAGTTVFPDFSFWKAAGGAALIAAITAAFRAAQALLTTLEPTDAHVQ